MWLLCRGVSLKHHALAELQETMERAVVEGEVEIVVEGAASDAEKMATGQMVRSPFRVYARLLG